MARITLFWCFDKKIFLNRMMEFQVKFCLHSGLRLWRTGMLSSTKSKCHKSNVPISGMYRYNFYHSKVQLWWPNKSLVSLRSSSNTLYVNLTFFQYKRSYLLLRTTIFCLSNQFLLIWCCTPSMVQFANCETSWINSFHQYFDF
jgi:hypothetical protein